MLSYPTFRAKNLDNGCDAPQNPGKGDRHHLCGAPERPFRQKVPDTFFTFLQASSHFRRKGAPMAMYESKSKSTTSRRGFLQKSGGVLAGAAVAGAMTPRVPCC